ncbi:hypothetical protein Ancab_023115 [Ancistrocladus abbreviatus]
MGRAPCCPKDGVLNRGAWTAAEDKLLIDYINKHGEGRWRSIPKGAGLNRCGKSCRLRWLNYLRPDIKRGNITPEEEDLIIRLHKLLGNRWSLIAGRLPGRTDNEIKNYWNTTLMKKLSTQSNPTNHREQNKKANIKSSLDKLPETKKVESTSVRNNAAERRSKASTTPHLHDNEGVDHNDEIVRFSLDGYIAEDVDANHWTNASEECLSVCCGEDNSQTFSIMAAGSQMVPDSDFWEMLNDWIYCG